MIRLGEPAARLALAALLLLACADDPAPLDASSDGGVDAPIALDAPEVDAPVDVGLDAPLDSGGASDAGADAGEHDAGTDAGERDAGTDAGERDAGTDAGLDAGMRTTVLPSFCPSTPTAPGLYRGTLAGNTNDLSGGCGITAPGRDGALRIELAAGATVRAVYRHAGDGALTLLDSCPVVASCLAGSDTSGEETLTWTNTGASTNPVYLVLDSDSLGGPQTFELDLFIEP